MSLFSFYVAEHLQEEFLGGCFELNRNSFVISQIG